MAIYLTLENYSNQLIATSNAARTIKNLPFLKGDLTDYINILSASVDTVQTLNIGSQGSGAGAGKVTFNPFIVYIAAQTSVVAELFSLEASGTALEYANLYITETVGGVETCREFVRLGLAALKEIQLTADSGGIQYAISFEYGGFAMGESINEGDNKNSTWTLSGWNRVQNISWNGRTVIG